METGLFWRSKTIVAQKIRSIFHLRLRIATMVVTAFCLAGPALAQHASQQSKSLVAVAKPNGLERLFQYLGLNDDQIPRFSQVMLRHIDSVEEIRTDSLLSKDRKRNQIRLTDESTLIELKPTLSLEQLQKLRDVMPLIDAGNNRSIFRPQIAVTYDLYLPSGREAREIFGKSSTAIRLGLRPIEGYVGKNTTLGIAFDTLSVRNSDNKLFVLSPELVFGYRKSLAQSLGAYSKVFLGPSYMDYSFDSSTKQHFGAKRLGAMGGIEIGLRYGRAQVSASYRVMSQPTGVNCDGLQLAFTYVALRF